MYSLEKNFSHVYIERDVYDLPRTQRILKRLRKSNFVLIDDYQAFFGRGKQDFSLQKKSQKLILARKKDNFLYGGNKYIQSSGLSNFRYNAMALNCLYDCQYCYLQGLYSGGNQVVFVNLEEFMNAAEKEIILREDEAAPLRLAVSYDTDLMAMEGLIGYLEEWLGWVGTIENIEIEVRTKSANSSFFKNHRPSSKFVFAWTLSPDEVASTYELVAPRLVNRVRALKAAQDNGWRTRICIDPIIKIEGWELAYSHMIDMLAGNSCLDRIERAELGVFRVSTDSFRQMRKRKTTDLLQYPFEHDTNTVSYKESLRQELTSSVKAYLSKWVEEEKIYLWT